MGSTACPGWKAKLVGENSVLPNPGNGKSEKIQRVHLSQKDLIRSSMDLRSTSHAKTTESNKSGFERSQWAIGIEGIYQQGAALQKPLPAVGCWHSWCSSPHLAPNENEMVKVSRPSILK